MSWRPTVLWSALVASLALLLWWTLEPYQYVAHLPSLARDRAASAVLLEQSGVSSKRVYSQQQLFPLPDTDTLLVFRRPRGRIEQENLHRLKHWVADGGTLILEARLHDYVPEYEDETESQPISERFVESDEDVEEFYSAGELNELDPLSYAFGVTGWHTILDEDLVRGPIMPRQSRMSDNWGDNFFREYCLDSPLKDESDTCTLLMCGSPQEYVDYASGELDGVHYRLDMDPHSELLHYDQFDWQQASPEDYPETPVTDTRLETGIGNSLASQLLVLGLGQGRVVVMGDTDIWSNARLHHLDHAALLLHLARDHQSLVWIEQIDMPPLLEWLWQRAWPLMVVAALLLAIIILRAMPRRGPVLDNPDSVSLDFIDHLRASARFLWRHRQHDRLLSPLRRQISRRLDSLGSTRDNPSRAALAAKLTGMDEQQIREALTLPAEDLATLTQLVNTLQALRSKL